MDKILEAIKEVARKNNIKIDFSNLNISLKKLNIDSLAAMNLIMEIEDKLKVTIQDEILLKIKTLDDLIDVFKKASK